MTRDTSDDDEGEYSLTCFIVGELARAYFDQEQQIRRRMILSQIVAVFGNENEKAINDVVDIVEQNWVEENWSRGAPCPVTGPGNIRFWDKYWQHRVEIFISLEQKQLTCGKGIWMGRSGQEKEVQPKLLLHLVNQLKALGCKRDSSWIIIGLKAILVSTGIERQRNTDFLAHAFVDS